MQKQKCNTEEEKPWLQDAFALFCSLSPLPKGSKYSGTRFNALTRLVIYVTAMLLVAKFKYWYIFLAGSMLILTIIYCCGCNKSQENFALLSDAMLKDMSSTSSQIPVVYNNYSNGMNMLKPTTQLDFNAQVQQIRSPDANNQLRLMPMDSANISNTFTGYEQRVLNTSKEKGKRDSQAGVQYYTPYVGVNPKTNIPPVIGPRITDQEYWGKQSTVRSDINKLQMVDVTNEAINTYDMAQIPDHYPDAQGYKYGYPLALPVKYDNRVPNGVWNMNPVGQDTDIGYYNSQEDLYNNNDYRDFNRNVLPTYQNPNSYVFPNIDMSSIYNAGTQPIYQQWDQANTNPMPPTEWRGITDQMAMQQMGGVCTNCNPGLTARLPPQAVKEGFSFIDGDKDVPVPVGNYPPQLKQYTSIAPPYPLQAQFNTQGTQGVFGGDYSQMTRVPPGQNVQIPAVTTQLMYQSPTVNYNEDYFNSPNSKLFLQTVQPQLYSYSVDQTPINSSVGIAYAPQKPPRVLDQVTANGLAMPLYSRVDPQLIRTNGTQGQQASQPTRSDWSAEYSNFQAPPGSINFEDIYDPRFTSYGDPYRSYSDVNLGQVQYYYSDVDAYRMPNFISRSNVDFVDFRTPNGQIWPEYIRNASIDEVRPHVENQVTADELYHREDLMSLQMDKINRERWQTRFAPLNNNNKFMGSSAGAGV